jgi:hypothetical protein
MTKITQLPIASTISDTGVFVILDQGITKQLPWQTLKAGGLRGNTGTQGIQGPLGPRGPTGTVTTIQIGIVTGTTTASVVASASTVSTNVTILDFYVPIGPKGDTGTYVLPVATTSSLGGVQIGDGIYVNTNGVISINTSLAIATTTTIGGVKAGEGISITGDGTISATTATQYYLPTATNVTLGGVKIGAGVNITNGVISVTTGAFALQTATNTILGGVKIGANITISATGTISVAAPYILPNASTSTLGGIKIGENLSIGGGGIVSVSSLAGTAITGTTLSSTITATSITSLGTLTSLVVGGNITIGQTLEVYTSISTASGTVVHNCTSGTIFIHNNPAQNWTADFTNVSITANRVVSVALLINQGAIPYIPSIVRVNGGSFSINWQGGVTPTGNANKKDLVNFTFVSLGFGNYTVLGSLASYG